MDTYPDSISSHSNFRLSMPIKVGIDSLYFKKFFKKIKLQIKFMRL